jgi:predicted secreted protein
MTLKGPTMSTTTVIAIYFLIWWITLFAVLPFGVRSQHEDGEIVPGTDPGAPAVHRVWRALGWTTVVATVVFTALMVIYRSGLIPFDWLMSIAGPPRR